MSHLAPRRRRLTAGAPKIAGRRGWSEKGADWRIPKVLATRPGPFWREVRKTVCRLIDDRTARLDGQACAARFLAVVLCSADRKTGNLHNPQTGKAGDFPSVETLARIAGVSMSVANRAMSWLRRLGYIPFTKHRREEDETGKVKSIGPSIRRLSWVRAFLGWPASLLRLFDGWQDAADAREAKRIEEQLEREAAERKAALAAWMRDREAKLKKKPLPPQEPLKGAYWSWDNETRMRAMNALHADHPDWTMNQLRDELLRRHGAGPPPESGPAEPPTSPGAPSKS